MVQLNFVWFGVLAIRPCAKPDLEDPLSEQSHFYTCIPVTHPERPSSFLRNIPGQTFLWFAIVIFGASSALTRKLTQIGAQHFMGGHNPISLCNVLFVGNLCALLVLVLLHGRQLNPITLGRLSRQEWIGLVTVAFLSGALAPGLIFQALSQTAVNNVVLVGRLEPPLTLALSVWILKERVNRWEVLGAIAAFFGVTLTILLQPSTATMMAMGSVRIGVGEVLAAVGAVALAISAIVGRKRLARVSVGLSSMVRTGLGTVIFFCLALLLYGHDHFMEALSPFLWKWMLLYGAVIVVVGQSFWLTGLRASSLSVASLIASFTPIAGILAAYFILGEVPTQAQYIGGSVILLGIVLSQIGIRSQGLTKGMRRRANATPEAQAVDTQTGFKGI
jgi:drug/metabolite transporter (DMT)-like permease